MERNLKTRSKIFYGVGNLGYSAISQTITNFFMFFGTGVLGMPGSLVGIAVGISTLWDGITDPMVGFISDNYTFKFLGKRRGYMFVATFGMALVNILIWTIPADISIAGKFILMLTFLLLIETFNTLYATPYGALGAELTDNYHEKTSVQVYKTVFFLVGMMIPTLLLFVFLPSTAEFEQGQLNPVGYKNIALVTSAICLICGILSSIFSEKRLQPKKGEKLFHAIDKKKKRRLKNMFKQLFKNMKECFSNSQQRVVIIGYSIALISAAVLTSVGMHFFTYSLFYSSAQITVLLMCLLLGTIVSQPLWFNLSKKKEKKPALLLAILVAIMGTYSIMFVFLFKNLLNSFSFYIILVSIFICGVGSGALYTLPNSMFCDVVGIQNEEHKDDKTASYYGYMTLAFNIANALALMITGSLLDAIGFNSSLKVQPLDVQTGIAIILFVGVLVPLILSYYIFSRYKLTKKDVMKKRKQQHEKPKKDKGG